ncbi:hypothetical protein WR25_02827 [Diploscapter pachys]|uniref:acid phosphatase n=1 Tax=Diploscapter pachys TaxID=2018661 RepID=A0A2A2LDE6_9BILA|nr:hypothetical protein WR25_02827 [Diploscapter pachys]
MRQHLNLGMKLRNRYIDSNGAFPGFLPPSYRSDKMYIRSTDINRTLISAYSNMIGMYGQSNYGNQAQVDYPNATDGWPSGFVPVPIHTVDHDSDYLLNTDVYCPLRDKWWDAAKKSAEVQNFTNSPSVSQMIKNLADWTGLVNPQIEDFGSISGGLSIEKIYFPGQVQNYSWYSDAVFNQIGAMHDQVNLYQNGIFDQPNMFNGVDIGLQLKKLRAGSFVNEISSRMQDKIKCNGNTDPSCNWVNNLNMYIYSAHDPTLYAFFSAIGVEDYAVKPKGSYPQYSACALIELYQKTSSKDYAFKLIYHKNENTTFTNETLGIPGCENATLGYCPVSVFQTIAARVKPDQPTEKWCFSDIPNPGGSSSTSTGLFMAFTYVTLACLLGNFRFI